MPVTPERRQLRFDSVAMAWADVDRLITADRAGKLRATGSWTLGQALGHLAAWASFPFDGYPPESIPPWLIRVIARAIRGRFLNKPMRAGMKITRDAAGTLATEVYPTADGHARFQAAFGRLTKQAPSLPSPIFGRMTHEQWIKLNLRHCELHLSFFHP